VTTITLPWPDKRLSPNAKRRKHWRVYQPAIKADRETGWFATKEVLRKLEGAEFAFPMPITVRFIPPDRRHRDDDGMIGSFKHMRDGIADAFGVDDRHFRPTYEFAEPEKPGRVEVVLG
jgi:crossover junction endodeoxyribonuclease RusA